MTLGKRVRGALEEGLKPAVRKTASTVEKAVRSAGHGFERVAKNAEQNEKEVAGNLRKYFVDDSGQVHRLEQGKLGKLGADDKKALGDLVDDKGRIKDPSPEEMEKNYSSREMNAKEAERFKPHDPNKLGVDSKKITEPTELSRATEEARVAMKDYKGRNYASLKYRSDDGKDVILVGRSSLKRSHSERSIGKPLLPDRVHRVSELYTEREPCQEGANCDRWLGRYFDKGKGDLKVTHGVAYDHAIADNKIRNMPHIAYQDQLLRNHLQGDVSGTMGSKDFDALTAPAQQQALAGKAAAEAARTRQGAV